MKLKLFYVKNSLSFGLLKATALTEIFSVPFPEKWFKKLKRNTVCLLDRGVLGFRINFYV